jgi:hypothetical protein
MILPVIMAFAFVLLGPLVIILGVILLRRGVRGRLVDNDPRCRACDYLLVHLSILPARCPECGLRLSPANVTEGARAPRWGMVLAGAMLATLGLAPMAAPLIPSAPIAPVAPAPKVAVVPGGPFCTGCARWHAAGRCGNGTGSPLRRPSAVAPAVTTPARTPPVVQAARVAATLEVAIDLPAPLTPEVPEPKLAFDPSADSWSGSFPVHEEPLHDLTLSWRDLPRAARSEPYQTTWMTGSSSAPALSWTSGLTWSSHGTSGVPGTSVGPTIGPSTGARGGMRPASSFLFDPSASQFRPRVSSPPGHRSAGFAGHSPASPHQGRRP